VDEVVDEFNGSAGEWGGGEAFVDMGGGERLSLGTSRNESIGLSLLSNKKKQNDDKTRRQHTKQVLLHEFATARRHSQLGEVGIDA
jgi:hypothetical protein